MPQYESSGFRFVYIFYFISFVLLTFVRLSFLFVFCFFAIVVIGLANFLTSVVKWYVLDHNGMQKKRNSDFFSIWRATNALIWHGSFHFVCSIQTKRRHLEFYFTFAHLTNHVHFTLQCAHLQSALTSTVPSFRFGILSVSF